MDEMKIDKLKLGRCSRYFYNALRTLDIDKISYILDIGCGAGRTFYLFDRFKNAKRVGIDVDMDELKKARTKCLAVLSSGNYLPFLDKAFDLIVEFHTLHHIHDFVNAISEVHRCLRDGGYFLMVEAVNDNFLFRSIRDKHPITKHIPIESNFRFKELIDNLEEKGFVVRSKMRFGFLFEFTIGSIPHMPFFVKQFTSSLDGILERLFGTKYCASCVVLAQKR